MVKCGVLFEVRTIIIIIIIIRGATGSDEPWPAEQPPLAVFTDCTRRYWVDLRYGLDS
jgi:hypothetical protein